MHICANSSHEPPSQPGNIGCPRPCGAMLPPARTHRGRAFMWPPRNALILMGPKGAGSSRCWRKMSLTEPGGNPPPTRRQRKSLRGGIAPRNSSSDSLVRAGADAGSASAHAGTGSNRTGVCAPVWAAKIGATRQKRGNSHNEHDSFHTYSVHRDSTSHPNLPPIGPKSISGSMSMHLRGATLAPAAGQERLGPLRDVV